MKLLKNYIILVKSVITGYGLFISNESNLLFY